MNNKDYLTPCHKADVSVKLVGTEYSAMIRESGFTDLQVNKMTEIESDVIEVELKTLEIKDSEIQGKGLFFTESVNKDDIVGDARINDKRTQLGRYTNHSDNPNVIPKIVNKRMIYTATKDIESGEEMTVDYRETRKLAEMLNARLSILGLHKSIEDIEGHLLPDDFKTLHHFSEGVYVREFHMEKDTVVIGKIHRHDHIAMLIKGEAIVTSERGKITIKAPHIWNSKAEEKRAVYSVEDCIFVTIHPTEETDLDKIEDEVIAPSYDVLELEQ